MLGKCYRYEVVRVAMDVFESPYYKLNKRLLSFLGQWPYQSARTRRLHRIPVILFLLTIIIPELIKLYEVWGDLDTVFECIPPLGLHTINVTKWINCVINIDKLQKMLVYMDLDWKSRDGVKDSVILRKYAQRGKFLTTFYTYYMFTSAILYVCLPLIPLVLDVIKPLNESRPREFLFRTEYFVDQNAYFVPIFVHALLTNLVSITIVIAIDTMYGVYVHYVCAVFAELGEQLKSGFKNEVRRLNVSKEADSDYQHVVKCVKKHKKAIAFCNILESTYSIYFLVVTGINILLMSFTGVQTMLRIKDPQLAIRYGSYCLGQIVHVFFGCWHGQLLIDHSSHINDAIFSSRWYASSYPSSRALTMMLMRSGKPCRLSAGKLFFVRLATLGTIIKMSMSYFTMLRSLR